jgi:hypothetical protein
MNQQKTKYQNKKDMNSFKERVSMKEEKTTPKKLLSPKGPFGVCYAFFPFVRKGGKRYKKVNQCVCLLNIR